MRTVLEVIGDVNDRFTNDRARGDAFERMMRSYFRTDPLYAARFSDVWLWQDWDGREGQADAGIDLVARDTDGGTVAIQCKFYAPAHTLRKEDIDSFFTRSGKAPFTGRIIVSTTDRWSVHAEQALEGQQIPVVRIGLADLQASAIDWSQFEPHQPDELRLLPKKSLRPHQVVAIKDVLAGFDSGERGRLIMACGTGKTFTSLKIAEEVAGRLGRPTNVLFLVPSIALLNQSLREWTAECGLTLRSFGVCSDVKVGKLSEDLTAHDLAFPATTNPSALVHQVVASDDPKDVTVVFSTYQSIGTIAAAQQAGLPRFDLIVCDEAHRTTGVTLEGDDESAFVRVHDDSFIGGDRRLYMTATPRIFNDETKSRAADRDAVLASMDDESLYGAEFHRLGFGQAVEAGLLTDYKVLVLNVDEGSVAESFQRQLADESNELRLDDAAKIVGCWNGLAKRHNTLIAGEGFAADPAPMRRAVAFCRSIKDSKALASKFGVVVDEYTSDDPDALNCELSHVDGTMNALRRKAELEWLQADTPDSVCRILSNARCLSEGVDVPSLDAVLFLNPRNSVVDVVQSVGRVMRRAPGKQFGYIILPVGIPVGMDPAAALSDNKRYKVVWQVLQALRAHDDRFNAMVNQIELNKSAPKRIDVIGVPTAEGGPRSGSSSGSPGLQPTLPLLEWRDAIYAKIVARVGERTYWERWADDIRGIAERHIARIEAAIKDPASAKGQAFASFVSELQDNLNPGVGPDQAVDMLAQHLVTKPVFDALFAVHGFSEHNPVSLAMQKMLDALDDESLSQEAAALEPFYASVRARAEGIDNHEGRQAVITQLYEQFFKKALPKTADALGIVYTPIEIVDFILRSVDHVLRDHLDSALTADGVHVLDPFTGTGTFIVRLLQSGLIADVDLARKYLTELHANELLLLAYYIAAINIEATFHQLRPSGYVPFDGIVLTDTFQSYESGDGSLDGGLFPENHDRLARQKAAEIRVIIGNPPYSVGQTSQNDDNKNQPYPHLDRRVEQMYVETSTAGLSRNLYDSYIRAFRWASDRIGHAGVVCFVSNGGWIDSNSADGLRKALAAEFQHIYVYNLRGNQRTAGELSKREGGKIFGSGSRATVAITLLVRDGTGRPPAIRYRDIGDYLSRDEKLRIVSADSLATIDWRAIQPNAEGDWMSQRDERFGTFTAVGDKARAGAAGAATVFGLYGVGVVTGRDTWCWGFGQQVVGRNVSRMVETYSRAAAKPAAQLTSDATLISWTRGLKQSAARGTTIEFDSKHVTVGSYRPFTKSHLYYDRQLNETVSQQPRIFPFSGAPNIGFTLTGPSSHFEFCTIATDRVPDLHLLDTGQFFPRWRYEQTEEGSLFRGEGGLRRVDNITAETLAAYRSAFGEGVTADDVFYYVYGLLHSPDYRNRYASDLKKMLPRIPMVRQFGEYATAGRALADLHIGYEQVDRYPLEDPSEAQLIEPGADFFRVEKMRFARSGRIEDRSTLVVNANITLSGIPQDAYRYMLGPRSAVEWVVDRYQVRTDKPSGIVNDPNDWCRQIGNPRYIVDLVKRIVTVSLETMKIVDRLPPLDTLG